MTELIRSSIFSQADRQLLMSRLWILLADQTERYTAGDSSSVTSETAQELLASLWYTIGTVMDETRMPYDRLLTEDLLPIMKQGQAILQERLEQTTRLWEAVCRTAPEIQNVYYADTLREIGVFFQHYDLIFFAHQKPPCIDYPLLITASETLQGLSFTEQYLKRMLTENIVLHQFDCGSVISLLRTVATDYQNDYLNLCEQPLTNAIGRSLIGEDGRNPLLSRTEQAKITEMLKNKSRKTVQQLLRAAVRSLCAALGITDSRMRDYLCKYADSLLPRLGAALESGDVSRIFPVT